MNQHQTDAPRIVVGVDGSITARKALVWALEEAASRGARLDVVHAWRASGLAEARRPVSGPDEADAVRRADEIVADELHAARAHTAARPPTRGLTSEGAAVTTLLRHSVSAELLVLGANGVGEHRPPRLGSVTARCLEMARIPVVVVAAHVGRSPA